MPKASICSLTSIFDRDGSCFNGTEDFADLQNKSEMNFQNLDTTLRKYRIHEQAYVGTSCLKRLYHSLEPSWQKTLKNRKLRHNVVIM